MRAADSRQKTSIQNPGKMSFWDHLDELRNVIIRAALLMATATALLFFVMPEIFDKVILAPCCPDFPTYRLLDSATEVIGGDMTPVRMSTIELININLASQLMIHLSISFWLAAVVCAPALLCLIWQFITPGLYKKERLAGRAALSAGMLMFYTGACVSYFIVFPLTLRFLAGYQLSSLIPNVISIDSYIDTFTGLTLIMGLTFELPVAAWIAGRLGIINRSVFQRYRRHAIVALLIVAALITPTGDPLTLSIVFLPLYILWEISALMVPSAIGKKETGIETDIG